MSATRTRVITTTTFTQRGVPPVSISLSVTAFFTFLVGFA
jgi:hypothetical protein